MTIKKAVYALSLNTNRRPNKIIDLIKIRIVINNALWIICKFRSKLIPSEKKNATNKISLIVHILSPSCFADL